MEAKKVSKIQEISTIYIHYRSTSECLSTTYDNLKISLNYLNYKFHSIRKEQEILRIDMYLWMKQRVTQAKGWIKK